MKQGISNLPKWEGADKVYSVAYTILANMGRAGHVTSPKLSKRGKVLRPGTVSEEMQALIEALDKGEEERIKGLILSRRYFSYRWLELD